LLEAISYSYATTQAVCSDRRTRHGDAALVHVFHVLAARATTCLGRKGLQARAVVRWDSNPGSDSATSPDRRREAALT